MKFKLDETRWHGCRYIVVEPELDYSYPNGENRWQSMDWWCRESFGPAGDVWENKVDRYYVNGGKFYFRDDRDINLFMLRWA